MSGDVRDASSPNTEEDLGWEGSGQEGGLLAKEWSVVLGHVCLAPHRHPGPKGGTEGKSRSHTQERFRGVPGVAY